LCIAPHASRFHSHTPFLTRREAGHHLQWRTVPSASDFSFAESRVAMQHRNKPPIRTGNLRRHSVPCIIAPPSIPPAALLHPGCSREGRAGRR
jgi:hypothetical protein